MSSLRVGLVGYGKMGQLRHQLIRKSGRAEVVAIADPFRPPVNAGSEGALAKDHWLEVIEEPTIDAVFIATANLHNRPITIAALKAGKHVFCEKPPAFNAKEVEEIIAVERYSGKRLMYGFNHRQHGAALRMKEIVSSDIYGNVLWMRGRYGKSVDADYLSTWRADPRLAGGGILLDQGIHMLDLFLYLGGPFDEVQATVSQLYWEIPGIEDNVFAIMRDSKTGRVASLHSTMTQWRHLFSLEVFMQRGYMVLNGLKTSSNTYGQERLVIAKNRTKAPAATWEDEEETVYDVDTSWEKEVAAFFDAIQLAKPITTGSSQHALDVMRLVDKIYEFERHQSATLFRDLS